MPGHTQTEVTDGFNVIALHYTLGHSLTLLAVQLETAMQLEVRGDPRLHEELREARQVAKACSDTNPLVKMRLHIAQKHAS